MTGGVIIRTPGMPGTAERAITVDAMFISNIPGWLRKFGKLVGNILGRFKGAGKDAMGGAAERAAGEELAEEAQTGRSAPGGRFTGSVKRGDDIITVSVGKGHATLNVGSIEKVDLIEDAILLARQNGATKGSMLTNAVTSDIVERAFVRAADLGRTWMGGKVTRMPDTPVGPQFRIDWDELPSISRK